MKIAFPCILSACLLMAVACTPQDSAILPKASSNQIRFGAQPSSKQIVIESEQSWSITPNDCSWCTFSPYQFLPGKTTVTVSVSLLPTLSPRSQIFTISTESGSTQIYVEQSNSVGDNDYFLIYENKTEYALDARDPKPIKILVNTNVDFWIAETDAPQMLSFTKDKDTLFVQPASSPKVASRQGTITLRAGGSLQQTLTFNQHGLLDRLTSLPNFTLSDPNTVGSELKFSDVYTDNRFSILYIWGSWCPDCSGFLPYLKKLYDDYHPLGMGIYGAALEISGKENDYYQYLETNSFNKVGDDGKKLFWENRPVFNTMDKVKKNDFTAMFYGEDQNLNFIPAIIVVNGAGTIQKTFIAGYNSANLAIAYSLYKEVDACLSGLFKCCGGAE